MRGFILFEIVAVFSALCSPAWAGVKSNGWVQYKNAIQSSFLETHGIYHEAMMNLVDHERARLTMQATRDQGVSCGTLEVDVDNIQISKPAILLKFQKNSVCMLSIGNSATDMDSLQYALCCSNELIEGYADAEKFHDALSFTKYILSQSDGAMWKKLIGPATETLSSVASTDDDFFSSDDGNDNQFDDTWFNTNDDQYTDDVSDDDSAMDDKQKDVDDDLHIFRGRRRLESEKKQIKRLCKRYGVCPAVFTPGLTECKIRHTKTVIPCHYENVSGDDDKDDDDNGKNWNHAERKVYRDCVRHGVCPSILTEGLTECMVRHTNITVACVYDETDASLLTGIPFMPGEQRQAEKESNIKGIDFGFMDDDFSDHDDDDYNTDPAPSVGTHGDSHSDRHVKRECDRHGICPIKQVDGIDECNIRHTNISMICKYVNGNLILTYPKSSVLEEQETLVGHHYHHDDDEVYRDHSHGHDHDHGSRHEERDIKRDCDRHGICPLVEIDGIHKCPLRNSNITMICEYHDNILVLTYPEVIEPAGTDAVDPLVGFELPTISMGAHGDDHKERHIERQCERHGMCPPMEMDGFKECPVRHTNITMICGYNHGILIYTYPKFSDALSIDSPYSNLEASESEVSGRGFGNHLERDIKRECDRYGICPVMEIDHIDECSIRHTNITMMCEYKNRILVFTYPKMNDFPLSAEGLGSIFGSDDASLDDFHTDDFFSGDDDTYRVTTHDDWAGYNDDDDDDTSGSDDVIPDDDDASKDNDDDLHIFAPNPMSPNGRTLHVEQVILSALSLKEAVLDKDISSVSAAGPLRTITIYLQDLSDDHSLSGSSIIDSLVVKVTNDEGNVIQFGGESYSGIENHNWPSSWKNKQQSKFGVTREIRLPFTSAEARDMNIQMSILHASSAETVKGVLSLGFEVVETSNGPSWFWVLSLGVILAAGVTILKSKFSKSTGYEYQNIPFSSMHGENSDVEMTMNTKPINIQHVDIDIDYVPGSSGYQTI